MVLPVFSVLFAVGSAAVATWALLGSLIPRLRQNFLDQPNVRSSHQRPTPRGGGLAFVVLSCAASGLAWLFGHASIISAIPLLALPLAVVGLFDDKYNLPSSWRYCFQLFTALLMLGASPLVLKLGGWITSGDFLVLGLLLLMVIAVTAVINFTNFMDGLDGLVAGCMAVAFAALAAALVAPLPLWALMGSLLGFLLWNWCTAKVFMGDVGSTFLGAVFAGLLLQAPSWPEALGFLLVATPLLGDACLCVLRRLLVGQRVFQPHRLHLFQRLHQAGWSHARVSLIYIAATSMLAVAMLVGGWQYVFFLSVVELLVGVWLDQHVAVPFAVASQP